VFTRQVRGLAFVLLGGLLAVVHAGAANDAGAQLWPVTPPALLGEYQGVTPCADCSGIELTVSFYVQNLFDTNSGTFRALETHQATADGDHAFTSNGRWTTMAGVDFDRAGWIGQLVFDERGRTLCVERTGPDTLILLERDCQQPTSRATPILRQKSVRPFSAFVEVSSTEAGVTDAAAFAVVRRTKTSGVPVSVIEILSAERRDAPAPQFRLCLDVTDGGQRSSVLTIVVRDELDQFSLMLWEPARCSK
jgi:uncharacterized lipoprotein NlpE involved in copper resistance